MAVDGFDLTGKRALVAGRSTVARAIAEALEAAGAQTFQPELGRSFDADQIVRETIDRLGGLEIAVICAGEPLAGPLVDLSDEDWDLLVSANLTTPLRLVRAAAREMLPSTTVDEFLRSLSNPERVTLKLHSGIMNHRPLTLEEIARIFVQPLERIRQIEAEAVAKLRRRELRGSAGRIIIVHSILAERGVPNTAAYGATQAALAQLIRGLALEWARSNIRINGIAAGWLEDDPLIPEADAQRLARYLASKRLGRADELGALAVYLASDAADMMTGQSIAVDGGAMIHA